MTSRQLRRLGAAAMVAVLAACGDGGGENDESSVGAGVTSTTAAPAIVRTATDAALGTIVVDAEGMTLYRNAQDTGTTITCTGDCAAVWPPVVAPDEFKPSGALGSIARPDGGSQVTYGGTPLYRYVEDKAAGETKGQGVGGIWFVMLEGGVSGEATTTTTAGAATVPAAGAGAATTTRPTTTTTRAGSRTSTPAAGATTTPTTAAVATTIAPATTTPPATSPPATVAPVTTLPPVTTPPTTSDYCYYPPCDP